VIFAAITLCVASQRVIIVLSVYFIMTQSENFWIHHRIYRHFHELLMTWKGLPSNKPYLYLYEIYGLYGDEDSCRGLLGYGTV